MLRYQQTPSMYFYSKDTLNKSDFCDNRHNELLYKPPTLIALSETLSHSVTAEVIVNIHSHIFKYRGKYDAAYCTKDYCDDNPDKF